MTTVTRNVYRLRDPLTGLFLTGSGSQSFPWEERHVQNNFTKNGYEWYQRGLVIKAWERYLINRVRFNDGRPVLELVVYEQTTTQLETITDEPTATAISLFRSKHSYGWVVDFVATLEKRSRNFDRILEGNHVEIIPDRIIKHLRKMKIAVSPNKDNGIGWSSSGGNSRPRYSTVIAFETDNDMIVGKMMLSEYFTKTVMYDMNTAEIISETQ